MSTAVDGRINGVMRDFLAGHLPEGLPAALVVRAAEDQEPVERPLCVMRMEDGESPHRVLRSGTFILELRAHADEAGTLPGLEVHQRLVNVLAAETQGISDALRAVGLKLKKFVPVGHAGEIEDRERGRRYEQRWKVWVEVVG